MTTAGIRPSGQAAPSLAVRARDLLASEWTKFWSVRSAYWTLLVAAVTPVVLSDLIAFALAQPSSKRSPGPPPDPMLPAFYSLEYAVLAVCVLGVLQFSSEYSTGLIRTTFVAAPRRRAVLAAKAVITGLTALIVGEVASFASFFIDQAILHAHHRGVSWSHPGVPGAVVVNGTLLLACAMLALALGAITRHTAGGIAATIVLIALPSILGLLPHPWGGRIGRFTIIDAAQQVTLLHPQADMFSPGISMLVLFAWPAAALAIAAVVITRTEA
jgi:ABC-2 type transport system permease protein